MRERRVEIIILLGALSAFAPLSIDMYLPAFGALQAAFRVDAAQVQLTLSSFFLAFALGQTVYGPITDRFGRRAPLFASLSLYTAASIGCAFAPSIGALMALRFFQALGACAGVVIVRAMVTDLFESRHAVRIYAALMLVSGLAPMLAPTIGSTLLGWFGWQSIFVLLAALGAVSLLGVALRLPETLAPEHRRPIAFGPVLAGYARLLVDRRFIGYALTSGAAMAGLFVYIAGSPVVFMEIHGVSPRVFGWLFGANALGVLIVAQVNGRLSHRHHPNRMLTAATAVQSLCGLALLASTATGVGGLLGLALPLAGYLMCIGMISPNATALAMAPFREQAGTASAALGTLQFTIAAIASATMSAIHATTPLPMGALIACCGILALVFHRALANQFVPREAPEPVVDLEA